MKIFISNRTTDKDQIEKLFALNRLESYEIKILQHSEIEDSEEKWKSAVTSKIGQADEAIIFIGKTSKDSAPMNWEFREILRLNKPFGIVKLDMSFDLPSYLIRFEDEVLEVEDFIYYLISKKGLQSNPNLLLDQYKMMVSSTEKVTDQRLKVNNLFFTVTTTILSFSLLIGKAFEFGKVAMVLMLVFATMAFIITYFWEKLIKSYGKLNTGKFKLIDEIEKQLKTNLFQREWEILLNEVGYESNTVTETTVIKRFRQFVVAIGISEIVYFIFLMIKIKCNG